MQPQLQVTVRDIQNSKAIEDKVRQSAAKLEHFFDHILSCKVVIEVPQKHKHQGKLFNVRIDLAVPGRELVVNRVLNEDLYVAIRDAFNALRRQLETYTDKLHGDVKVHELAKYGHVSKIFSGDDYGFIVDADGNEFYFHANNITYPDFVHLQVGDTVHFLESVGGDGPQAVNVRVVEH
jgi:ribosomal subunit interface protein